MSQGIILLLNLLGSVVLLIIMTVVLCVKKDIQGRLEMKRLLEEQGRKVRFRDIH